MPSPCRRVNDLLDVDRDLVVIDASYSGEHLAAADAFPAGSGALIQTMSGRRARGSGLSVGDAAQDLGVHERSPTPAAGGSLTSALGKASRSRSRGRQSRIVPALGGLDVHVWTAASAPRAGWSTTATHHQRRRVPARTEDAFQGELLEQALVVLPTASLPSDRPRPSRRRP